MKNIIHKIALILIPICMIGLSAGLTEATTYYVDQNCPQASDLNSGTEAEPFKTVQKGLDSASTGEISGILNTAGSKSFTIEVTSGSRTDCKTFLLNIAQESIPGAVDTAPASGGDSGNGGESGGGGCLLTTITN